MADEVSPFNIDFSSIFGAGVIEPAALPTPCGPYQS
jgi:hypothetical protein